MRRLTMLVLITARVVVISTHIVTIRLERRLRQFARFCHTASARTHELADDITPTWRETASTALMALALMLALAFLLVVGSD